MPQSTTSFSRLAQDTFGFGRHLALDGAIWLQRFKPAGRQLAETGAGLVKLLQESGESLIRQQVSMSEQSIDLASKRLKRAAEASDFRELVQEERRLLPESAARVRGEIGTLAHIYFDTRAKLNILARDASDALLIEPVQHRPPTMARPPKRETA